MYAADSIDRSSLATPVESAAARGELPAWAEAGAERRAHVERVARLLESWARELRLPQPEVTRWRAAGMLHDSLRDAAPEGLREELPESDRDLPDKVLHGPAAAGRLHGLVNPRVETAIRYHTIGSPHLDELGRALYLADFLEPGRAQMAEWRAALRERMPDDRRRVLVEVVEARLRHALDRRLPLREETASFWSALVTEEV